MNCWAAVQCGCYCGLRTRIYIYMLYTVQNKCIDHENGVDVLEP